jgi:hypothetical protein
MKVELSLHAINLKNVAGALKGTADPFAVVTHISTEPGKPPVVLGKTEVLQNTLSPQWVKVFEFDYELGTPMKVVASIFHSLPNGGGNNSKSMGSAVFDIGELLGARGNVKAKRLVIGGTMFAHVRKCQGSGILRLKLKGLSLKNVEGVMRKSDPFFELSRQINSAGAQTWDNIYRSDPVSDCLDPAWKDAIVSLSTLCGGDQDLPVRVAVFDYEKSGRHVSMGQFETSVNGLVNANTGGAEDAGKAIPLKLKGELVGSIIVLKAEVAGVESVTEQMAQTTVSAPAVSAPRVAVASAAPAASGGNKPSFVDYISGGCQLSVVVAIDFTGSNGNPRTPGTLHYMSPDGAKNDYEKAITSILSVLSHYDSDQLYPVRGFGAKYNGVVDHAFQCGDTGQVHGIDNVVSAYRAVFKTGLIMSSPTVFTNVIQEASDFALHEQAAAQQKGKQAYTILLIVSDGAVEDAQATMKCLNDVSDSPLSVVIVGVGGADFSAMRFLDDGPTKRDIAQFVEFNQHKENPASLSSATLNEIPNQLVGYFQSKGIQPLPTVVVKEEDIVKMTLS